MTIQELNKYAGRKRRFEKEAKAIFNLKKNKPKTPRLEIPENVNDNDNDNDTESETEESETDNDNEKDNETNFNNVQQNLKFAKSVNMEIKEHISNHNRNLNLKNFARNIRFKSINLKKNKSGTKHKNKKFKSKSKNRKMKLRNKGKNFIRDNDNFDKDFNDLPRNFKKWAAFTPPVRNQGKCGSCYAVSTLNMLESRLNIKLGIKEELSLDHVLNCSVYNQGCEGGYSYLVLKFAKEIELIPKRCEKNHGDHFQCGAKKCKSAFDLIDNKASSYKVKNFGYLGGSYGKCSEEILMRELMKNGPVVVSFEPDYHFMMYKKGIYKSLQANWMSKNLQKPEWEKVDHSVTLVGWGYDEVHQKKYWLLLNSWGKHWGENGFFRMVRGEDHSGIESICEIGEIAPVL